MVGLRFINGRVNFCIHSYKRGVKKARSRLLHWTRKRHGGAEEMASVPSREAREAHSDEEEYKLQT